MRTEAWWPTQAAEPLAALQHVSLAKVVLKLQEFLGSGEAKKAGRKQNFFLLKLHGKIIGSFT